MYYVNVSFAWILVLLSLTGYFYVLKKKGEKWAFWLVFAAAYVMFGTSHALVLAGTSANEWYMTFLRVLGYVLMVGALLVLMVRKKAE
jgi:hypothetical protein